MIKLFFLFVITIITVSCSDFRNSENEQTLVSDTLKVSEIKKEIPAQNILKTKLGTEIPVYSFEQFKTAVLERKETDITYLLNFWATWCGPCVAELPYFFELEKSYAGKNIKFIYVSLDFMESLENKLIPFVESRKMNNEIVVLDQKNANEWMELIDKNWSGSIPATLIFNKAKRKFMETSFESAAELREVLEGFW